MLPPSGARCLPPPACSDRRLCRPLAGAPLGGGPQPCRPDQRPVMRQQWHLPVFRVKASDVRFLLPCISAWCGRPGRRLQRSGMGREGAWCSARGAALTTSRTPSALSRFLVACGQGLTRAWRGLVFFFCLRSALEFLCWGGWLHTCTLSSCHGRCGGPQVGRSSVACLESCRGRSLPVSHAPGSFLCRWYRLVQRHHADC